MWFKVRKRRKKTAIVCPVCGENAEFRGEYFAFCPSCGLKFGVYRKCYG